MASAPDPAPVDLFLNPTLSKHSNGELMDLPGTLALITRLMLLGSQSLSGVGGKSVRVNNLRAANYLPLSHALWSCYDECRLVDSRTGTAQNNPLTQCPSNAMDAQ